MHASKIAVLDDSAYCHVLWCYRYVENELSAVKHTLSTQVTELEARAKTAEQRVQHLTQVRMHVLLDRNFCSCSHQRTHLYSRRFSYTTAVLTNMLSDKGNIVDL